MTHVARLTHVEINGIFVHVDIKDNVFIKVNKKGEPFRVHLLPTQRQP